MTDDEDLDLSAWQPPAAPDVADAVIARMRGAAAVEAPSARPRWWLLGAAGATIAASVAILALRSQPADNEPPGELVATGARHVALEGASADVDAGAQLRWSHDRDGLRVEQRGRATWSVTDRLRIDAGIGSIEATEANLRVEVEMNRQDLHVISTSAITAAAVALVTIVVYDGHVRATSAGQTIVLQPGTTFQIVPDHPVATVPVVSGTPPPPPPPAPPAPPPPPPPPPCDVTAMRELANASYGNGDYRMAEQQFRLAYKCKPDSQLMMRAYLAACKALDAHGAIELFRALPPEARPPAVIQICLAQGIDPREKPIEHADHCQPMGQLDPASSEPECGAFALSSDPAAVVMIDGVIRGKTPLAPLEIAPGKHKITFVVGDDRYTYAATVLAGQTMKLVKNLR